MKTILAPHQETSGYDFRSTVNFAVCIRDYIMQGVGISRENLPWQNFLLAVEMDSAEMTSHSDHQCPVMENNTRLITYPATSPRLQNPDPC